MPLTTADVSFVERVFTEGRTHKSFTARDVPDDLLRELYDLARLGPTASNGCPMRVVFVKSAEAKERLFPALAAGNVEKSRQAPVTAIVAHDLEYYLHFPLLAPYISNLARFAQMPEGKAQEIILRNSSLQGAYLMLAARTLGLDCGPMSGFNNEKVDTEFFAQSQWRSNFLVNLGYGSGENLSPRAARLDFGVACRIL